MRVRLRGERKGGGGGGGGEVASEEGCKGGGEAWRAFNLGDFPAMCRLEQTVHACGSCLTPHTYIHNYIYISGLRYRHPRLLSLSNVATTCERPPLIPPINVSLPLTLPPTILQATVGTSATLENEPNSSTWGKPRINSGPARR